MSQLVNSVSRSPRFWLALVFFGLPLVAAVMPGSAESLGDAAGPPAEWVAPATPWTPVPLDATTDGTLVVRAVGYPRSTSQAFTFSGDVAGTIPAGGFLTVTDVPAPGAYFSTETVPGGWSLNSIQCDDGSHYWGNTATMNLGPAQTLECRFFNQELGSEPCLELAGRWPFGPSLAVDVDGPAAYLGSGSALVVVNVSTPSGPQAMTSIDLGEPVRGIDTEGSLTYVVTQVGYDGSLVVVDTSDPWMPSEIGRASIQSPFDVELSGSYAYVASGGAGLTVVDVANPVSPTAIGWLSVLGYARGLSVSGGLAYVASSWDGLRVIDVSTPSNPVEVGSLALNDQVLGVHTVGGYAYVANDDEGLRIIDVSNPAAPVETGFLTTDRATEVQVVGSFAYVADGWSGLDIVDVSNPASPAPIGTVDVEGSSQDVVVDGAYAFVAGGAGGMSIVDLGAPVGPGVVGRHEVPGEAYDADLVGELVYLSLGYEGGLIVLDISDPSAPEEVNSLNTVGAAEDLEIVGGYAFQAAGDAGLRVLDVANPVAPIDVAGADTPGWATAVDVVGDFAYVADSHQGLRVVDVGTPISPIAMGGAPTSSPAIDVAADATHAYVATVSTGVEIFDVSIPASPQWAGIVSPTSSPRAVALRESHLIVAGSDGLRVIDVSTPAAPVEIGSYDGYVFGSDLVVRGDLAHVIDSNQQLLTYDIGNPTQPMMVRADALPAYPLALGSGRSLLLLTQGAIGLEIHASCSLMFADDFETGDTTFWSATAGGP